MLSYARYGDNSGGKCRHREYIYIERYSVPLNQWIIIELVSNI